MEKNNSFLDAPIDPERVFAVRDIWETSFRPEDSDVVATRHVSLDSKCFVILREIAKMFVNGTKWNKKARIVLEYDPQAEKMAIKTFMEYGEADAPAHQELSRD